MEIIVDTTYSFWATFINMKGELVRSTTKVIHNWIVIGSITYDNIPYKLIYDIGSGETRYVVDKPMNIVYLDAPFIKGHDKLGNYMISMAYINGGDVYYSVKTETSEYALSSSEIKELYKVVGVEYSNEFLVAPKMSHIYGNGFYKPLNEMEYINALDDVFSVLHLAIIEEFLRSYSEFKYWYEEEVLKPNVEFYGYDHGYILNGIKLAYEITDDLYSIKAIYDPSLLREVVEYQTYKIALINIEKGTPVDCEKMTLLNEHVVCAVDSDEELDLLCLSHAGNITIIRK